MKGHSIDNRRGAATDQAFWYTNENYEHDQGIVRDFTEQMIHELSFTNPLHVNTGVKQGRLLSPALFLIAIDWVT